MKQFCERFDVYFDDYTGEYIEEPCMDPQCEFCVLRPKDLKSRCKTCFMPLPDGSQCKGVIGDDNGNTNKDDEQGLVN